MQPISLFSLVAFAATASASTINLRGDAQYAHQTCGVNGATNTLDHDDIQSATDAFGAWLDDGADGQLSANGNFKGSLGKTTGKVTIFACDRKKSGGSIISSRLVSGATGAGGFIDTKCGVDNAGYESSNDLTIGRTFAGDHYC